MLKFKSIDSGCYGEIRKQFFTDYFFHSLEWIQISLQYLSR